MTVHSIDPLRDVRWEALVSRHPRATVFHTTAWLDALRRTYRYEPVVLTTTPPGQALTSGVVSCRVNSWLTGRRVVAVPFADHCEPLAEDPGERGELLRGMQDVVDSEGLKYAEVRLHRPEAWPDLKFKTSQMFAFHTLDLGSSIVELFSRLHKDGFQRKIRRATREGIQLETGRSDRILRTFFRLLTMTRRRHGVPPQPFQWFQHLRDCMGDRLSIRVAFKDGRPIASILTLHDKDTVFYKYGGSDAAYHSSGGMPCLLWKAIEDGREAGFRTLDLGRSDLDNVGLITFKQRLGAASSVLTYLRYPAAVRRRRKAAYAVQVARSLLPLLPEPVLVRAGRLFYRHAG